MAVNIFSITSIVFQSCVIQVFLWQCDWVGVLNHIWVEFFKIKKFQWRKIIKEKLHSVFETLYPIKCVHKILKLNRYLLRWDSTLGYTVFTELGSLQ